MLSQPRDTYKAIKRYAQNPSYQNELALSALKAATQADLRYQATAIVSQRNLQLEPGIKNVTAWISGADLKESSSSSVMDARSIYEAAVQAAIDAGLVVPDKESDSISR